MSESSSTPPLHLPRIRIAFCTQCKWMLRAAYYAQELLSTFSTSIGEIALVPSTGGVFTVDILYHPPDPTSTTPHSNADPAPHPTAQLLWDRKTEGGFPETKILKRLVRNCIDPERGLGHVDGAKGTTTSTATSTSTSTSTSKAEGHPDGGESRSEEPAGGSNGRDVGAQTGAL